MSKLIDSIIEKAKQQGRTIVLPEGTDKRVVLAAEKIAKNGIAKVVLLGDKLAADIDLNTPNLQVVNPATSEKREQYAQLLFDLRKAKGMTEEEAAVISQNPLFFGALMVKSGDADGMVAGAINSTGNVLRAALQTIKTASGINTVSSCFVMGFEGTPFKQEEVMVFGDCAVNIAPSALQLCDIAIATTMTARTIAGIKDPKVAMLSFSTKGSARHENVDKVTAALQMVRTACPDINIDGELQVDAALSDTVAALKAPQSEVAGKANVFIFPDLQSGNIGYKLVQRFSGAEAIGPICQGFAKPVNDLSRGCVVDDIVAVAAITALQAAHV